MKILTNIRFYRVAGIAQSLMAFLQYLKETPQGISIVGVNVTKPGDVQDPQPLEFSNFLTIHSAIIDHPEMQQLMKKAHAVTDIDRSFRHVIEYYASIIREEKPDLVLVNGTYVLPWCLYIAARACNVPIVVHYHGIISKETEHWDEKSKKLFLAMERQFDDNSTHYIFPSELAKRMVEEKVFLHPIKNCSVLPNGVNDYFFTTPSRRKNKKIGFVCRWARIKNTKFIEQFSRYLHRRSDNNYNIEVVTDGLLDKKIRQRCRQSITFKKPIHNNRLSDFYRSCGAVASPSLFETYGNVPQEAIATGTPALISSNMGVAETFRKIGLDQYIIDFASPKKVLQSIELLLSRPVHADAINALRRDFSNKKIFSEMVKIFRQVA